MDQGRETLSPDARGAEPAPGSLNCNAELCLTLKFMIEAAQLRGVIKDRNDLAERMSRLTGETITRQMIDAWTAPAKRAWRFPFEYAAAFETACASDHELQVLLSRKRGTRVMDQRGQDFAEFGEITLKMAGLSERSRLLKDRLLGGGK